MKFSFDSVAHLYKDIYYKMPQSMKTVLGTLYGTIPIEKRFGPLYTHYLALFQEYETWSEDRKAAYLFEKTRETLTFAQEHIPFYQKRFAEYGVHADDFRSLEDLKKFPTFSKADIKNHIEEMYSEVKERAVAYYSGGSTSSPTKFYHPLFTSRAKHKAYSVYTLGKVGYRLRDRTLLLKGREAVDHKKNRYWDYEPVDNFLNITSSYIISEKFSFIYEASKKFRPKFIFGYPSAVSDFVHATRSAGLEPIPVEGVILASESVYAQQISELKEYYGDIPIFTDYGHTERVVGAYRLDFEDYRMVGAYGIAREVDGEIIGTSLDNFVMPYINYRTGDEVSGQIRYINGTDIMKSCGEIKGRRQDYLVTYDYRLIPLTTLFVGHHLPSEIVMHIQYRQKEAGRVTVLVEKGREELDRKKLLKGLKQMVPEGIFFEIEIVQNIPKTERGKRVVCVQELDIDAIKSKAGRKRINKINEREPDKIYSENE